LLTKCALFGSCEAEAPLQALLMAKESINTVPREGAGALVLLGFDTDLLGGMAGEARLALSMGLTGFAFFVWRGTTLFDTGEASATFMIRDAALLLFEWCTTLLCISGMKGAMKSLLAGGVATVLTFGRESSTDDLSTSKEGGHTLPHMCSARESASLALAGITHT
tara:strand:- start:44 stop:541 length:498 start_codon:yes stop_codon:yes gene_type:complete